MLRDLAEKYYIEKDYNCSETLLAAANEYYGLGITDENLHLISGFGGGLCSGETCGALCGSVAAVARTLVDIRAHAVPEMKPACAELVRRFKAELSCDDCVTLKSLYWNPEERCLEIIRRAADVLENYMNEVESIRRDILRQRTGRPRKVVIVGGVAGGASTAARLRRLDEKAEIILLEKGPHISFANCGLPYYVGGVIQQESKLLVQTPASFSGRFNVDVRVNHEVLSIDRTARTVSVKNLETGETYSESYDKLVLSPGAKPIRPNIPGTELPGVFTLRTVPDATAILNYIRDHGCKKAAVIGGGNIGIEMAENFVERGLETVVVEFTSHVITSLDTEMAELVHNELRSHGVTLMLGTALQGISEGENALHLVTSKGELDADVVLLSTGVRPESSLALDAGLQAGVRGTIAVNSAMQTSDPDIYALGDAVEVTEFVSGQKRNIALAGPANRQGRIVADRICGIKSEYTGTQGSSVTKVFDLTVACTGLTEAAAKQAGIPVDKVFLLAGSHAGYYPGGQMLTSKVLFNPDNGKILGGQFIGEEGADKRCDVLAVAIRAGMTGTDLTRLELCYAPPFSSAKDPINMAGFAIENAVNGIVNLYHWDALGAIDRSNATLLDVRTSAEYEAGHVDGFINIPLHELRNRLSELPKDKPVYVHCFSGLRSYVGCRILTGNGYDCFNISGGWFLYDAAFAGNLDAMSSGSAPAPRKKATPAGCCCG